MSARPEARSPNYGQADRIWVMDRGIPTEDSLAKMRSIGASYLVGTPKGRLTKLEQDFLNRPWAKVRDGVQVKRLATEEDVYALAQSDARIGKERGMRQKRLRRYIERLKALPGQSLTRAQLLMKLGAAEHDAGRAAGLVKVLIPKQASTIAGPEFRLDRQRLRQVRSMRSINRALAPSAVCMRTWRFGCWEQATSPGTARFATSAPCT